MKKKASEALTPAQRAELESLARLPDDAIDTSDAPEVLDWSSAKRGVFYRPIKQQLTLRLDADVIAWFKTHTESTSGYQTRINQALRDYVQSHTSGPALSERSTSRDNSDEESVPGYQLAASDCMNRALKIAMNLSHTCLSSDHLMLALTMDSSARQQFDQVGNSTFLREVAMRRLARMHSKFSARGDHSFPTQTSDFINVRKAAWKLATAQARPVTIRDLINAFPKSHGRLAYGLDDYSRLVAGEINPRADFTVLIETVHDVMQRQKSIGSEMLFDLTYKHFPETEASELSNKIKGTVEAQFAAALEKLDEQFAVTWIKQSSS